MLMQADVGKPFSAHVIVLGNEKGGSGKSTTAMHVAVALLQAGQRVATIDLDSRQKSFTHYVENRRDWAARTGLKLHVPEHYCVARGFGTRIEDIEQQEFAAFADAVSRVEQSHDFVVIDTPGSDSYLMRLAHSMADTLITPLNDSFVDFDVLGVIDPTTFVVAGASHYAEMVREARRQRRLVDGGLTDWIVVRNRLSTLGSRNRRLVGEGVEGLARQLGFRSIDGFAERVVYREFFPRGLTALDELNEDTLGLRPTNSHATARDEVKGLIDALKLPMDERGKRRAAARAEWIAAAGKPLEMHDLLADL
ncbi:MAG TPA: division plane positioning ATPase MipZ [Xanthobacteraceae bacterium]|jgi:chromosome partitioning protein|nr:division plane positioning ATPase MipZ [Xanthobacteraceae bacterium]